MEGPSNEAASESELESSDNVASSGESETSERESDADDLVKDITGASSLLVIPTTKAVAVPFMPGKTLEVEPEIPESDIEPVTISSMVKAQKYDSAADVRVAMDAESGSEEAFSSDVSSSPGSEFESDEVEEDEERPSPKPRIVDIVVTVASEESSESASDEFESEPASPVVGEQPLAAADLELGSTGTGLTGISELTTFNIPYDDNESIMEPDNILPIKSNQKVRWKLVAVVFMAFTFLFLLFVFSVYSFFSITLSGA